MARGVNQVILLGRMTKEIDMRTTPSGKNVGSFSLAVNRNAEEVDFIEVTAWEKTAELTNKYTNKGSQVLVQGSLRQESWEDKESGKRRSKLSVTAFDITFLDSKKSGDVVPSDTDDSIDLSEIPFN